MKRIHHVYAIKNLLSKGPSSDDSPFSDRLVAHFLQVARGLLIERKTDKYRFISEQSYQSVCLDLELSSFHNCCDTPTTDCMVLRSTIQIPKLLNSRWGSFIKVMDMAGVVIPELSMTSSKYSKYGIIKPTIGWFIHDGYLYIAINQKLEKVILNGLFMDPSEVQTINCNAGNSDACVSFMEEEFPIDSDLVSPMYDMVLVYLTNSNRNPTDLENNAKAPEIVNSVQ